MVRDMALTAHMVTIDCADPRGLAKFWTEAVGYEVKHDMGGEYVVLGPPSGGGSRVGVRLGLQRVPEPRVGKNRVHVDWAADDREAEVTRLVALGASVIASHSVPGLSWTVLADPVGNEFCVSARD
jgi:predicted enzyme related to lactoylglutathione lyase